MTTKATSLTAVTASTESNASTEWNASTAGNAPLPAPPPREPTGQPGQKRLVSLVPSVTEILFELGLGEQVAGVSHQCRSPEAARSKPALTRSRVPLPEATAGSPAGGPAGSAAIDRAYSQFRERAGSPYTLDRRLLGELDPDVIFDQGICEVCAIGEAEVDAAAVTLRRIPEVVTISVSTLDGIVDSIGVIGHAAGAAAAAERLAGSLRARIAHVRGRTRGVASRPRVFCMEWLDPVWCAGHWVPEMVELAGGEDLLGRRGAPSVRCAWDDVVAAAPDVLVLMPCSFDVARTLQEVHLLTARPGWETLPAVRSGRVWVADSGAFSHHSHRTVEGLEMLAFVFHPDLFPEFAGRWPESLLLRLSGPAEAGV